MNETDVYTAMLRGQEVVAVCQTGLVHARSDRPMNPHIEGRGRIIAYCDAPMVAISDGTHTFWWRADLVQLADLVHLADEDAP